RRSPRRCSTRRRWTGPSWSAWSLPRPRRWPRSNPRRKLPAMGIVRLGHVEYRVTDLERARAFYVDLLGLIETARDRQRIFLRCIEDTEHHSFVLRQAESAGVGHVSFKVATPDDLDQLEAKFIARDLPVRRLQRGEEPGQGAALRMRDPFGFPVEYYAEMT